MWVTIAYGLLWLALIAYLVYPWIERHRHCWIAVGISLGAWICLTVGLVERSIIAGHWPLTNRYEFALCLVWSSLALHLLVEASWRGRSSGFFVMAVVLFVASYAVTRPEAMKEITPLLPALRSPWLQLHAVTAAIAYA
ncbi:MAG: cytochrome c biogenesis protein CcsA, partial [Anaerolineae bacterium]